MWLFPVAWHGRVVLKSTSAVVPMGLYRVQDWHQRWFTFAFVRNDAVSPPLHHPLYVLLQSQLAPVCAVEIHFPLDIFIDVSEHLPEQLMP